MSNEDFYALIEKYQASQETYLNDEELSGNESIPLSMIPELTREVVASAVDWNSLSAETRSYPTKPKMTRNDHGKGWIDFISVMPINIQESSETKRWNWIIGFDEDNEIYWKTKTGAWDSEWPIMDVWISFIQGDETLF